MKVTITMTQKKATPGTFVYEETSNDAGVERIIPSLYIRKAALTQMIGTGTIPDEITVTVEV